MLTTTSIDTTLKRYEIESFKKKNTKRVPFEEIDFNIYKTSQINYSTTEKRLPIWIKALYSRYIENKNFNETEINTSWQEIENPEDPAKCDKIILTFTNKENENVLSITINVTAGRMKAQGRLYKEWSEIEFQIVLDMVNASCDTWKYDNTTAFKDIIQKKYKGDYSSPISPNSSRDKTFSQIKLQLANVEAEFILHKEKTEQTITELSKSLEAKDEEIVTIKKSEETKQQFISDLVLKITTMEETMALFNKRCKKLEDQNCRLQKSILKTENQLKEKQSWAEDTPQTMITEFGVQTSNPFDILQDEPPTTTTQENELQTEQQTSTTADQDHPPITNPDHPPITNPEHPPTTMKHETTTKETIIICDSNGRHLKPKQLCPDPPTRYIPSPTLSETKRRIDSSNLQNPKNIILHCGTNDLENPEKDVIKETTEIINHINKKHPNCRILVSSLLPRQDELNPKVTSTNRELKHQISTKPNTTFIEHTNISNDDLYDKKHLNTKGVKKFATNLKAAYFQTTPRRRDSRRRQKWNPTHKPYGKTPLNPGYNNLKPPFNPTQPIFNPTQSSFTPIQPPYNPLIQPPFNLIQPPFNPIQPTFNPSKPPFNPIPNSTTPGGTQHPNKKVSPPPSLPHQDPNDSLPPQLIGLLKQLTGYITM